MLARLLAKIILFLATRSRRFRKDLIQTLRRLRVVLKVETEDSKKMLRIYRNYLNSNATQEEIIWANSQFRDLFKTLGIGVILILPFAPITLPLIVIVSKRLGVDIIPDSFSAEAEDD